MSVYFKQGKGWRYDFTMTGQRATKAWFTTKKEAVAAEAKRREELINPVAVKAAPIDMGFLDLVNRRLDDMKESDSERHYMDTCYMAKRWVKEWGDMPCESITRDMVRQFVLNRAKVSHQTANKEMRYLRATFNYGINLELITSNPVKGSKFLPVEKKAKRVPTPAELDQVIAEADQDTQDYLHTIRDTMARVGEINRLTWEDVNLGHRTLTLYTRKKEGGDLTPRVIPLTQRLYGILVRRFEQRDPDKPWVYWHRHWSKKAGKTIEGPYRDRKRIMSTLCEKAGVKYFRFHPMRHSGASVMESRGVPTVAIQRILGHENRKTTEIYLHSMGNAEVDAIRAFEGAA
ncbi:MAG: tyrosine-type recombinase/integrase [Desulfobulbaceae bacterium]|nr:tyrosine-type recombinase/integrase [Desulfobulbaceae bacterium]